MSSWQAVKALRLALKAHLPWNQARLTFIAQFILALLTVRSVNLAELATALSSRAKRASNYTRLQRFFRAFPLDQAVIARAVVHLLPLPERWALTLDRTNWQLGRVEINILVLAVVYEGLAVPLFWTVLGKAGNSTTAERIALLEQFLATFGRERVAMLLGDREFIGAEWLGYLHRVRLPFRIRIKANTQVSTPRGAQSVRACFADLAIGQQRSLRTVRHVWGCRVYLAAQRLSATQWLIVISSDRPQRALSDYALRWSIELLFGALKSRGFRFEDTHLTDPERLSRLLALLTLATAWAVRTGQGLAQHQPIAQKKTLQRPLYSYFRYGLDHLRFVILHLERHARACFKSLVLWLDLANLEADHRYTGRN